MPKAIMQFEYLDPEALIGSKDFHEIEAFLKSTGRTQIGWHYIVDLTWIYTQAKQWPSGLHVLDAGGGAGPTQFLLAEMGMHVTNIDLAYPAVPYPYTKRYALDARRLESYQETEYLMHLKSIAARPTGLRRLRQSLAKNGVFKQLHNLRYAHQHNRWRCKVGLAERPLGHLCWLSGNLCHMPEMTTASFDAVVSLSALEHIPMPALTHALMEIDRVLKPGARRAITTSAAEKSTWYHEPSKGLCFGRADIEELFRAELSGESEPARILEKYRTSTYLQKHLAGFYKQSGNNGMPWGTWSPQYIPVGIKNTM